ncbi:MAG: hypothetical protein JOZ01_00870, partial [Candidatus Eremiobacteraeota bacterium]|nr:hypothetical protein [Candidatus Eremiobacteraeota bacterium]
MPGLFGGIGPYFCRAEARLDPLERDRLERTLRARSGAEGTDAYTRYAGFFTLGLAAFSLVPGVPYALPYAVSCLALAIATLAAYLRFRRATQRRVAPLVRRRVWDSLPPAALASTIVCIAGAAVIATLPGYRIGALAAIISGFALC